MSKSFFEQAQSYAPSVVRIALALVFLWFGVNQLLFPGDFMGYLPSWTVQDQPGMGHIMHSMVMILPNPASNVIFINGLLELVLGGLLITGLFTRISALVLALHLFLIAFSLGYNDIAIRDIGLSLATFSIFLHGPDKICVDCKRSKNGI